MKIGLLGFGAIGRLLYELIASSTPQVTVAAVADRRERHDALQPLLRRETAIVASADELAGLGLDLVVECAGQAALGADGPRILAAGTDLLIASVGALANLGIESSLRTAAAGSGARVLIPSGALGGLDVLAAASLVGLREVNYFSNKAPSAWRGTEAERRVDLDSLSAPHAFFSGDARTASLTFPQNANVAAAVALAGVGFEKTAVTLTADPFATGNTHRIVASGDFGSIDITVSGRALKQNPKTSMLAPYSLLRTISDLRRVFVLA